VAGVLYVLLNMKTLRAILTYLIISSLCTANEIKKVENISLVKSTKGSHLIITQWSAADKNGIFLLSVEPGCGMLPVKITSQNDQSYTFQIEPSDKLNSVISRTKSILKIHTNKFIVRYENQPTKLGGLDLGVTKVIISVTDCIEQDSDS
jgi:hypothetical protein